MSPLRDREIRPLIVRGLIFLAVGGNGYFIKRLVDKIDKVDDIERTQVEMRSDLRMIKWRLGLAHQGPVQPYDVQSKEEEGG